MSGSKTSKSPLTDAQIRELIKRAKNGDSDAREKVILEHLDLAKRFSARYIGYGASAEDLYQEACYGLLLAFNAYDPDREANFATFSRAWMKKYICKYALPKQNRNIPSCYDLDFYLEVNRYIRLFEAYKEENGQEPTENQMAEILGISLWRTHRIKYAARGFLSHSVDLDAVPENFWWNYARSSAEEEYIAGLGLSSYKNILTPRELEVIERRLGYKNNGVPETYPEISAKMGISFESIRMLYKKGISKIAKAEKALEHI